MNPLLKEKIVNFSSAFVFLAFFIVSMYFINHSGIKLEKVNIFDITIILLSSFRMIRLLLYEKIFSIIRKFINDRWENLIFGSIGNLISCPWCTGVWVVLFAFDLHYLIPYGNYFNFILAVSSIASIMVILINMLNLKNEILRSKRDKYRNT